ncbi:unnamed protein product, partial [Candidula unifasciata]
MCNCVFHRPSHPYCFEVISLKSNLWPLTSSSHIYLLFFFNETNPENIITTMKSTINVSHIYIIIVDDTASQAQSVALISDEIITILKWIVYTVVCQLVNGFGIVTNIINIACFIKQGFKDTTNICLM